MPSREARPRFDRFGRHLPHCPRSGIPLNEGGCVTNQPIAASRGTGSVIPGLLLQARLKLPAITPVHSLGRKVRLPHRRKRHLTTVTSFANAQVRRGATRDASVSKHALGAKVLESRGASLRSHLGSQSQPNNHAPFLLPQLEFTANRAKTGNSDRQIVPRLGLGT